uniref:Putative LOC100882592 [Megachile rotundata] n=1 Tax=Lepeophtheirus salmonis TaxID=72036 RepID=A0A0K2TNQ1_LEPSM
MRKLNLQEENERKIQCVSESKDITSRNLSCDSVDISLLGGHKSQEAKLMKHGFSILRSLLHDFTYCPDLIEVEDILETSPGLILHYFCILDFQEGVKKLFHEPFVVNPNVTNKNGFSALWVASWSNHIDCAHIVLKQDGDPNFACSVNGFTPLHLAVLNFHENRVNETCDFIDHLIQCGANLKKVNSCGETAAHLAVQTANFRVISKFVSALGPELLELKESEDSECSFFMYAVGRLDEKSIYQLITMGAPLISSNVWGESLSGKIVILSDSKLPLQEAVAGGNSDNYFNALLRCSLMDIKDRIVDEKTYFVFLCCHLIAAARDLRSDVIRMIFQNIEDIDMLHSLLIFKDTSSVDDTFTKTPLQWAVENSDRLCTTEILHQEYQCHKLSKEMGLRCLRNQLKGDELLTWTIETFTVFYDRTVAQKCVFPLMALVPVFFSIFNFTYDYYSDISLTLQYFSDSSFRNSFLVDDFNATLKNNHCRNFTPTPHQFFIAFAVNLICITAPLLVFFFMCVWEIQSALHSNGFCCPDIMAMFLSLFFTPFFVLYVAGRQVYYKFRHARAKQKNLFRDQLRKSEFFWGITRSAEAGLESCGQLILQIWLLSFNFYSLLGLSFEQFLKKSLHGVVLILSFSINEADDIEQSLGKVFLSVISLVFSVSSGYRMLKRGSLRMNNAVFIYLSTFFQVLARICGVSLFFVGVRSFSPIIPLLLLAHFALILVLKLTFESDANTFRSLSSFLVSLLTVFASSMVYVRITPLTHRWQYEHRSTFVVQFLFFLIVFIENIILSCTPILFYNREDTLLSCLSPNQFNIYVFFIILLSTCAWFCHIFYYKCMGHPWSDINGPGRDSLKKEFHVYFQVFGKEKLLIFNYGKSKKTKRLSTKDVDFI